MRRIAALARLLPGRRYACPGYGASAVLHCGDDFNLDFILRIHQFRLYGTAYRRMTGDDPCIPGLIHRRKVCTVGEENSRIKNT